MSEIARPELFKVLLVFVGSGVGGVARYGLDAVIAGRVASALPLGILVINVSGSLAIGLLGGMIAREDLRALVLIGLLGGYTTFSAFSRDTLVLAQEGRWLASAGYVIASVVLSLGACWLGMAMSGPRGTA